MKKISFSVAIFIFILNSVCFYTKPTHAFAQSEYRRVIDSTTPFYTSIYDQNPIFFLPYTYYVKVIEQVNTFTHIEIHGNNGKAALDGYVPSDLLFDDGLEVLSPYLNMTISTINTTILYSDTSLTQAMQYIFSERNLNYYGEYISPQGKIFYVSYNNKLGYVKEEDILPFTINNHPNELTFIIPPQEDVKEQTPKESLFELKTIIIVCLFFAGIIALFIAFSNKSKHQKASNYYEENDYE